MEIFSLDQLDPAEWKRFERAFSYRLDGRLFRYESDPQKFFGAFGEPFGWFARAKGSILSSITGAIRMSPSGPAAWLGMIRTQASLPGKFAFGRTALVAVRELRDRGIVVAAGGVMAGTERLPGDYSGRIGIPRFLPTGKRTFLSLRGPKGVSTATKVESLEIPHCSSIGVQRISEPFGEATLEDTRLGKRLYWLNDGQEFSPRFLTRIKVPTGESWIPLIQVARSMVGEASLFLSPPSPSVHPLLDQLPEAISHSWTAYSTNPALEVLIEPTFL